MALIELFLAILGALAFQDRSAHNQVNSCICSSTHLLRVRVKSQPSHSRTMRENAGFMPTLPRKEKSVCFSRVDLEFIDLRDEFEVYDWVCAAYLIFQIYLKSQLRRQTLKEKLAEFTETSPQNRYRTKNILLQNFQTLKFLN